MHNMHKYVCVRLLACTVCNKMAAAMATQQLQQWLQQVPSAATLIMIIH